MEWEKCFVSSARFFVFCGFSIYPQFLVASDDQQSMNSPNHSVSNEEAFHYSGNAQELKRMNADLHAAMVQVAQGVSHLSQARQGGEASDILRARRSLNAAEGYYIQLLASSSAVAVSEIEEMHLSGISLAQIGFDLRLVRYPNSRSYIDEHPLDTSGTTMESEVGIDHQVHNDAVHGVNYDHHETIDSSQNEGRQKPVVFDGSLQGNIVPHPGSYDNHSAGGGMMGGRH